MEFKVISMIEKLDEEISDLDNELAYLNSRIDTLECYQSNNSEVDELIEKSNELEEQKSQLVEKRKKYAEMLNGKEYTKEEIEANIEDLNRVKNILNEEFGKTKNSHQRYSLSFQINSIDITLAFFEKKLAEISTKNPKR